MFTVIDKNELHRLSNLEMAGYAQESDVATELLAAVSELDPNVQCFKKALAEYQRCLALAGTEKFTDKIHKVTADVVAAWNALYQTCSGHTIIFADDVTQAAKSVVGKMDRYGSINRLTYDATYGTVSTFVAELTDDEVSVLGIGPYVSFLNDCNSQFVGLSAERKDYRKARKAAVQDSRERLELCYRLMVRAVENYVFLNGVEAVEPFVNRINELVSERVVRSKSSSGKSAVVAAGAAAQDAVQAGAASGQAVPATEVGEGLGA